MTEIELAVTPEEFAAARVGPSNLELHTEHARQVGPTEKGRPLLSREITGGAYTGRWIATKAADSGITTLALAHPPIATHDGVRA